MKIKLKPTEIVDRFISDWKDEIQFTKQGIELHEEKLSIIEWNNNCIVLHT